MTKKARSVTNWFHGKQIKPKCEHKYDYQHTVVRNTEKETGISRNTILWTFIDLSYDSTSIFSWCVIINTIGSNIMTRPLHQYRRGYGFKSRTGLNFFFRPYFNYWFSSVHNNEDRFYIRCFNRSAHIWFSYIYSHYSLLGRFVWIQHDDQLPVGLLAQLVERCKSRTDLNFFRALFQQLVQ